MTQLDGLRRYIEAATTLTQITRGRAEELVKELVASGEVELVHAQEWIEDLVNRSREASENLVSQVSSEVDRQLDQLGIKNFDMEDLAARVAGLIDLAGSVGRDVMSHGPDTTGGARAAGRPKARTAKSDDKTEAHKKQPAKAGKKRSGGSGGKSSAGSGPKSSAKKKAPAAKTQKSSKSTAKKSASKKAGS